MTGGGMLSVVDKKEVESLLKYGAYDLFNEAADAASQRFCLSEDMQVLTDRGFMSRAEVFAACPELAPSSATARSSTSSGVAETDLDSRTSFGVAETGTRSSSSASSHSARSICSAVPPVSRVGPSVGRLSASSSSLYPSVSSGAADSVPCDVCGQSFPFDYYAEHQGECARCRSRSRSLYSDSPPPSKRARLTHPTLDSLLTRGRSQSADKSIVSVNHDDDEVQVVDTPSCGGSRPPLGDITQTVANRPAAAAAAARGAPVPSDLSSKADDEKSVDAARPRPAAPSSPLRFASLDPATGHLVYLTATALTWKTVTSLVEFTHAAEAPHWASDADEYGLTPGQAARMQAASDRARDGDTEAVDKFHVDRTSNGLSLIVDAHHDMFVRVGLSVDVAGDVPNTVWANTDYHKVKAGALLTDSDTRQRVKMTGQAEAGLAASADAEELPFKAELGLTDEQVDVFLLLYGYWLGDGSIHSQGPRVSFSPKKLGDKKWLFSQLDVLGLTVGNGITASGDDKANGQLDVYIVRQRWNDYFCAEYGPKYELPSPTSSMTLSAAGLTSTHTGLTAPSVKSVKWFWMWVWRLRKERARLVLDGLRFADGSESCDINDIWTSGCHFRDDIIRLCLHAGYSARFRLSYKDGDWRPGTSSTAGAPIPSRADGWMVSYSDNALAAEPVLRNHRDIRRHAVPRGVQVWCPTVPPHSLIIARRVRKNAKGIVTQASRPIVVGNCEEDIDQILQQRTTVVTQQAEMDEEGDGEEAADGSSAQRRRRQGTSTFSKANFTSAASDSAVDLHASDFWEQVIPDQRTAAKLAHRLTTNEGLDTLPDRATFLDDLFMLVQEVIASHQQGTVPTNTSEVLTVLANVSERGGEGGFTEEQRAQAVEWMQEIERPRRQRRQLERWSDISSQAFIDAAGGSGVDGMDLTGEWRSGDRSERGGDSHKRRKMQAQTTARQFTRKERRAMIGAVITYAGLCPAGSATSPSLHSLVPPVPSIWRAMHVSSGLIDRPLEQFAGFCLAFLAYCSTRSDEEDSMVFQSSRQRLVDTLPPVVINAVVEEVLDETTETEQNGEGKLAEVGVKEEEHEAEVALISPLAATSPAASADMAPLSPTVELPPPAVLRSHSSIPASSSFLPPPAAVRAASTVTITERYARHTRNPSSRTITVLPTAAIDPRTVEYTSIPCMVNDKLFHKHVIKRVKKWSSYAHTAVS